MKLDVEVRIADTSDGEMVLRVPLDVAEVCEGVEDPNAIETRAALMAISYLFERAKVRVDKERLAEAVHRWKTLPPASLEDTQRIGNKRCKHCHRRQLAHHIVIVELRAPGTLLLNDKPLSSKEALACERDSFEFFEPED